MKKKNYLTPIFEVSQIQLECGFAAGSVGQLNFGGQNGVAPEMEDWIDNSSNLSDFEKSESY